MKYKLSAEVTISIYTEVEADSEAEAILIAEERSIENSDFQGQAKLENWVSDDYDGEPMNIRLDEN